MPPEPELATLSRNRLLFYLLFGLILPVVCVLADPIVFVGDGVMKPLLPRLRVFAYLQIAVGLVSLILFLVRRQPSPFLAGILFECALFAAGMGVVVGPVSLIGILTLIGLLGFTPIVSACVYGDAARRAMKASVVVIGRGAALRRAGLGAMLALAVPLLPQVVLAHHADRIVQRVLGASASARDLRHLDWLSPVADLKAILAAYESATPERKIYYAKVYQDVTGHDIESDLWHLWYDD